MTLSDFDMGWALRKAEEAEIALKQAKVVPNSVRKYFVVRAILAGRQSLAQLLNYEVIERGSDVDSTEDNMQAEIGLLRVLDTVAIFLQNNEIDPNSLLNIGDLVISTVRKTVLSVKAEYDKNGYS
jgi:hypothetical protein